MDTKGPSGLYPTEFFRREDESDDAWFYAQPRLVVHIDDQAIAAIGEYLKGALPRDGVVLDLMSSWRSHLPESPPLRKVVGLGLNALEMRENPQLHEHVVHDLNREPALPFPEETFDAALVTVSIQYMVRPVEVFAAVRRVLKPGAAFHVIYSNRMFPTKAIALWQAMDYRQRAELIASYFINSGGWEDPTAVDVSPSVGYETDPVFVVSARVAWK